MTAISRSTPSSICVAVRRLFETAVDGVRALDGVGDDLRIRRIVADERDVGAMERGDDFRNRAARGRMKDLLGQQRRRRMRDRVVRVDDVEIELAAYLDDGIGQRQQILRLTEERVGGRLDLVERQVRVKLVQTERCVAAHQMHAVAGVGQCLRQLGRDDPAPSDRCVTEDANFHLFIGGAPCTPPGGLHYAWLHSGRS